MHKGLTDRVFGAAGGDWRLVRCAGCGAGRLDPRPADSATASLYASYYTHEPPAPNLAPSGVRARTARALRNRYLNAQLGYRLTPAWPGGATAGRLLPSLAAVAERGVRGLELRRRVLDVGAGNGLFVAEAAHAGWAAAGIDPDPRAVQAGRAAGLDLTTETVFERLEREPRAYDAVTLSHAIEHVADPVAVLGAVRGLLAPGGSVWIATPNLASTGHRRFGADWLHLDPPRHFVLFDAPALATALARAGFTAVRVLRPTPVAGPSFRISAALRRHSPRALRVRLEPERARLASLLADLGAQRDFSASEELVVSARPREHA